MNILWLVIGAVVGFMVGYLVKRTPANAESLTEKMALEHQANIKKAIEFIDGKDVVTNDELQNLLKVSDSTVGRYLNELEKSGHLTQIGTMGRSVSYKVATGK